MIKQITNQYNRAVAEMFRQWLGSIRTEQDQFVHGKHVEYVRGTYTLFSLLGRLLSQKLYERCKSILIGGWI